MADQHSHTDRSTATDATGERKWPANFHDRLTTPLPKVRDLVKMVRQARPVIRRLAATTPAIPLARQPELPRATTNEIMVTWVGHASYVLQIGGLTVLTDPVWSDKIPGTSPRVSPVGVDWSALPRVDAVVISHNHYDHLDAPTIDRLPRDTPLLVPGNLARWFRRRRFTDVTDLDWWESRRIGGVTFDFVPAHHWSRRTLTDTNRSLWGGWVLTTDDDTRLYFAGDTGYGHWFAEIGRRYPGIDLALMPVGAYEPNWFMRPVHLNPEEAVRACLDLGAARMATMHWGTFVLTTEPVLEPREKALAAWAATGRPREDLWDLAVGESRALPANTAPAS